MSFDVTCDACGTGCAADADLLGERVECPACGHVFVAVDPDAAGAEPPAGRLPALPPTFEVYGPPTARVRTLGPSLNTALLGWSDRFHLGRGPAAALWVAVVLCVFGIVSPTPVQVGMIALPVWALGFLALGVPAALGRESPAARRRRRQTWRRPFDLSTLVARSALIAAGGAGVATWGLMVHGRAVFDLTGPVATPMTPVASADLPPAEPAGGPAGSSVAGRAGRPTADRSPFASAAVPAGPAAPPPAAATAQVPPLPPPVAVVPRPPAGDGHPVSSIYPGETPPAAAADEPALATREERSIAHLRVLCRTANDYARRTGRLPMTLTALPRTAAVTDALVSPFGPDTDRAGGYALPAAGALPSTAGRHGELAILYDAAELADRGATVGITAAGHLVYLDAQQVADERVEWRLEAK